jgi:hypothetical protein
VGNQMLYDLVVSAVLLYLVVCLCIIGSPRLAMTLLRLARHAGPFFLSSKIPSNLRGTWPTARMDKHS